MKRKTLLPFGMAALLLSACSDNNPNTANESTASAVTSAVGLSLEEIGNQLNFPSSTPRGLTGQGSFDFNNLVISCRNGGTVTVSGNVTFDVNTDVMPDHVSLTDKLSDQFNGCVVKASNGKNHTIDGTLAIEGSGTIMSNDFNALPLAIDANFNSHITGTVSVKDDQANATDCQIDLQISTTLSGTKPHFSGSHSWSGTVCGNPTEGTFSFGKNHGGKGDDGDDDDGDKDDGDKDDD